MASSSDMTRRMALTTGVSDGTLAHNSSSAGLKVEQEKAQSSLAAVMKPQEPRSSEPEFV